MEWIQGVDANFVMRCMLPGHVSQGLFHSRLRSPPPPCQQCEKWCTSQKQREVIFDLPCPLTPNVPYRTASKDSHPRAQIAGLVPVVARGIVTGLTNWTVHHWQFSSIRSPFSLSSSRCVSPLSCCFWFLLKCLILRKSTTTGAGYRLFS